MSGSNTIPVISRECPRCQQEYNARGKAHALTAVCENCNTYFGFGKWMDEEATFNEKIQPAIPVYAKGKIKGVTWQILGFVVKRDKKYKSQWREYCMFNPVEGLAFLSEYNGHWNFLKPISQSPRKHPSDSTFKFEGDEYNLFQKYYAEIVFARGEFTFDIFAQADRNRNFEYISPPYMLGQEVSNATQLWYKGEYITSGDVAEAFQISASTMPPRSGVGATQPALSTKFTERGLITTLLMLVALVFMVQIYFSNSAKQEVIINQTYYKNDLPKDEKVFVTEPFTLTGTKSLTLKVKAPVDNDWFYADFVLVNETTGEEYNFSQEVAYYHGYDDGTWSEGSTVGEAFLSSVPEGRYHIVIFPEFSITPSFNVLVVHDVSMPSNMLLTVVALCIFPIGFYIYKRQRDVKRWSESDYSPYESDD